jgi:hypothetical protein
MCRDRADAPGESFCQSNSSTAPQGFIEKGAVAHNQLYCYNDSFEAPKFVPYASQTYSFVGTNPLGCRRPCQDGSHAPIELFRQSGSFGAELLCRGKGTIQTNVVVESTIICLGRWES